MGGAAITTKWVGCDSPFFLRLAAANAGIQAPRRGAHRWKYVPCSIRKFFRSKYILQLPGEGKVKLRNFAVIASALIAAFGFVTSNDQIESSVLS